MNEIYKLLLNVQEIAKANNIFLSALEQRMAEIERKLTIETSGPDVPGTENTENQ